MKEVILYLVLLPWYHRPEVTVEKARYANREACINALTKHDILENKKYLLKEDSYTFVRNTPGKKFIEHHYGMMRLGYYRCGVK